MAHEEAAFSRKHSAVSENQNQRPFTAKDAEDAKESKQNQQQNQRPLTTKDTKDTEGGKALPLIHGKPGQANADEQERVKERAEALALKLAQTYEELTRLLERNPGMKRQMTEGEGKQDKVYQKLKHRLKLADMAPRCQWVRQDGTSCGSPQMKQHIYCFAHMQMAEARDLMLRLPPPEDANAIQVGLMRIQKAVIDDTISMKKARLLLYSMQLALTNVGQTTFGKAKDEEMVRETVDEEIALSNQHSAFSQDQSQNQRPFTAEDAKDTEEIGSSGHPDIGTSENRNLPRMNAEGRGLEGARGPVEWKPTPDMYRMDTPEGRAAYEASFGTKIEPALAGERRPVQRAVGAEERTPPPRTAMPHEPWDPARIAETHANLG
jgi:hypothetical protein